MADETNAETVEVDVKGDSSSVVDSFNKAATAAGNFGKGLGALQHAIASVHDKIDGVSSKLIKFGVGFAVSATAFAYGGSQIEVSLRNVMTVADRSVTTLGGLTNAVIRLSTQVPQSAKDLSSALYDITSSGFQGAAALDVLNSSSRAASAGLTDTATAAGAIAAILNAYGKSADQAGAVSDVLFQTVNVGVLSFSQLANTVGDWAALASTLHVPLGQATAALAAMTLSGTNANQASTQLTRTFEAFLNPTAEMKKAFQEAGFASADLALKSIGLEGALKIIQDRAKGSPAELRKYFVSVEALNGVMQLGAKGGENYARALAATTDPLQVAGATQKAFAEQSQSLDAKMKILKNTFAAISNTLGTAMLPFLKLGVGLMQVFANGVLGIINMLGPLKYLAGAFALLIPVATIALGLLLKFAAVRTAQRVLALLGTTIPSVGAAMTRLSAAWATFGAALANSQNQYGGALGMLQKVFKTLDNMKMAAKTAGSVFAGVAIGVGLAQSAIQKADAANRSFVDGAKSQLVMNDINSINQAMNALNTGWQTANKNSIGTGGAVTRTWKVLGGVLNGVTMGNLGPDVIGANRATETLSKEFYKLNFQAQMLGINTKRVMADLGTSAAQVVALANENKIDLGVKVSEKEYDELIGKLKSAVMANVEMTTSETQLSKAVKIFGDITKDAEERLGAYKTAMDAVMGVQTSFADAQAGAGAALRTLNDTFRDSGYQTNAFTEKGAALQAALTGSSKAAQELAAATYRNTGDIKAANAVLSQYVAGVRTVGRDAGASEAQIDDMITRMGLMPKDLTAIIDLVGADPTVKKINQVGTALDTVNQKSKNAKFLGPTGQAGPKYPGVQQNFDVTTALTGHDPVTSEAVKKAQKLEDDQYEAGKMATVRYQAMLVQRLVGQKQWGAEWVDTFSKLRDLQKNEEDRQYADGTITSTRYIGMLRARMAGVAALSPEWYEIQKKIKDINIASEDKMAERGAMSTAAYISMLRNRLTGVAKFSDQWYDINEKIKKTQQESEDQLVGMGYISNDKYANILRARINSFAKFSTEWYAAQEKLRQFQMQIDENMYSHGYETTRAYVKNMQEKLKGVAMFSTEWFSINDKIDNVVSKFKDPVMESLNIVDKFQTAVKLTGNDVTIYFEQWKKSVTSWKDTVDKLSKSKIDRTIVETVVAGGPKNDVLAKALLTMDPGQINGYKGFFEGAGNQVQQSITGVDADARKRGGMKTVPTMQTVQGGQAAAGIVVGDVSLVFQGVKSELTKSDTNDMLTKAFETLAVKIGAGARNG